MLRKRTRSHQKDHHMNNPMPDLVSESYFSSDIKNQKPKNNSFLKVSGLFVGFNPKNSESDSVRSPTSPLDFRIFSSFGNPFRGSKSQNEGHHKSWGCSKVGLSIIDSLEDETNQLGKDSQLSENKNILFGRQRSVRSPPTVCSIVSSLEKPKSLPKDVAVCPSTLAKTANTRSNSSDVVFEIGEALVEPEMFRARSMDSGRYGSHLASFGTRKSRFGSGNFAPETKTNPIPSVSGLSGGSVKLDDNVGGALSSIGSIPAGEIELSEDYTCVRTHGPNPKVTHIFGDCILECHNDKLTDFLKKSEDDNANVGAQFDDDVLTSYAPEDFLKFCYSCQKKLDGEDIYMYRGEKAFCSYTCRSHEIEIEEEMEKSNQDSSVILEEGEGEVSCSCSLFVAT